MQSNNDDNTAAVNNAAAIVTLTVKNEKGALAKVIAQFDVR